jgi:hypothetical protein
MFLFMYQLTEREKRMPKYKIEALRKTWYEVTVEAEDEVSAYAELDDWIADDFEDFETNGSWEFEIVGEDNA